MQYYPVIYTRTRCCDYFAGFHVRPDFVVPAEVLPYIRTATTDMDAYEHTQKHLIISTDKMILFGIVGFIQDIGGTAVELYARDEKNRAIFGFYGFAAKMENDFNTSKIPDIQDRDIIRAYEKYVMPYWNCLDQDTQKAEPISLEEKEIAVSPIPEEFLWNETVHVHSETDNPDRLYTTLLLDALNGTVLSYCSCVNDFKALKNSRFSHVVTNKNNRFRLEKEQEERLERERQERERLERERQERERLERERQEWERQEREKKHSKKKDTDCTIEDDSSYGTQKKNKDTSENYPGINSNLDSNLSNYHDWEDVLEESEYEQLKKETAGKIQEALQEKASKSNKFDRFMKQYWRIIGAICVSIMIPIMIGLIKNIQQPKARQRKEKLKMPNELEVFEALNVDNRIPKADALEAYYKIHGALCREYHEEIDYVLRQLEDIRKERLEFTEKRIPQIRKNLAEQMVSKEAIDDWCNRLKADMEHSFAVSEEFLNNFIIAKSKEFERELQTRLGKV